MRHKSLFISRPCVTLLLASVLVMLTLRPAHASHPEDGLELLGVANQFNFSEFEMDDVTKNMVEKVREQGWTYGGEARLKKTFGNVYLQGAGGLQYGVVDYDGETSLSGVRHQTKTTELMQDLSFTIGRVYESWRRYDYAIIYGGLGLHRWSRDIETRDAIVGLKEFYSWYYLQVGARGHLFKFWRIQTLVELTLTRTMFPKMQVNFRDENDKPILDAAKVDLGEHYGARLTIPIRLQLTRHLQFTVEPFLEAWDLGRSEHMDLTAQGFNSGLSTHQPASESRFYGVNVGFAARFN